MGMVFDTFSVEGELSGVFDSAGLLDKRSTDGHNSSRQNSRSHVFLFQSVRASRWIDGLEAVRLRTNGLMTHALGMKRWQDCVKGGNSEFNHRIPNYYVICL